MGKQKQTTTFFDKAWKHVIAAILAFGLAYGAASAAIDSGSLFTYFITLVLIIFGIYHVLEIARRVHAK